MLLTNKVSVTWNASNYKYYQSKNYILTKMGNKFEVGINDLNINSGNEVIVKCDYCSKEFTKKYTHYVSARKVIEKDCCNDVECMKKKRTEVMLIKYNVTNPLHMQHCIDKAQETCMNKYGVKNPNQVKEVRNKFNNTMMKRYGVDNISKLDSVKEQKAITMNINGTAPCSSQQKYLYNLIGGQLNYPIGRYLADIALIDEKIIIEVDASGHTISYNKMKKISKEDFEIKENIRDNYILNNEWRIIRLITNKDKFPSDDRILKMINLSKKVFNQGYNYIKFFIEHRYYSVQDGEVNLFSMGHLRKITKKDV